MDVGTVVRISVRPVHSVDVLYDKISSIELSRADYVPGPATDRDG